MSKILFISDLHLAPERPDIIQLFIKFLDEQAVHASELYILGDFVEYWIGDDDKATGLEPAFTKLKEISDRGIKVHMMHGNRDFLMGDKLAERCGFNLIQEPYIANLNGTPAVLLHGDILCTDDLAYQELRSMLRNPAWQEDFLAKPIEVREEMARALREQSKKETKSKSEDIMDANEAAVTATFKEHGVSLIIHGHTHRPKIHKYDSNGSHLTRIVLGDWYTSGSVLEFQSIDDFQLREFS